MSNFKGKKLSSEEMKDLRVQSGRGSGSGNPDEPCSILEECPNGNILFCRASTTEEKCQRLYAGIGSNPPLNGIKCGNQPIQYCNPAASGSGFGSGSSGSGSGTNSAADLDGGLL